MIVIVSIIEFKSLDQSGRREEPPPPPRTLLIELKWIIDERSQTLGRCVRVPVGFEMCDKTTTKVLMSAWLTIATAKQSIVGVEHFRRPRERQQQRHSMAQYSSNEWSRAQ